MKHKLLALIAAIGLAITGLVAVQAPAQAVVGSTVGISTASVDGAYVRATNTAGTTISLVEGKAMHNVYRACPRYLAYKIRYTNPAGNTGTLAAGECLVPVQVGTYNVVLISS